MTPSYPTASLTRSQGMVFHRFSGDPVTRSKRTHPWMSGVTMLVRWLCSFPASETGSSGGSVNFVLPRPQKMHPSATREPTGFRHFKGHQSKSSRWSCCHWIFEQGMHPTTSIRSELLDLHFDRGPRPGYGGKDLQNEKKQRQRQASHHPKENRQRDHQARRRSRKESLTQVAQNERERVIGQHEESG